MGVGQDDFDWTGTTNRLSYVGEYGKLRRCSFGSEDSRSTMAPRPETGTRAARVRVRQENTTISSRAYRRESCGVSYGRAWGRVGHEMRIEWLLLGVDHVNGGGCCWVLGLEWRHTIGVG